MLLISQVATLGTSAAGKVAPENGWLLHLIDALPGTLAAIGWPLAIVSAAYFLTSSQGGRRFIEALGSRITKLSFMDVAIELRQASPATESWAENAIGLLIAPDVTPSELISLNHILKAYRDSDLDYFVVDVGDGHRWLASRLLLFSVLLEKVCGVQWCVFVASTSTGWRTLIGYASVADVRAAFGARRARENQSLAPYRPYTHIMDQFRSVYSPTGFDEMFTFQAGLLLDDTVPPERDPRTIAERFVAAVGDAQPPNQVWLAANDVRELMGRSLATARIEGPIPRPSSRAQADFVRRVIVEGTAAVMALVERETFADLVNREKLVESVAQRVADDSA